MSITITGGLVIALGGMLPALAIGLLELRQWKQSVRNPEAAQGEYIASDAFGYGICRGNCNLRPNFGFYKIRLIMEIIKDFGVDPCSFNAQIINFLIIFFILKEICLQAGTWIY